MLSRLLHLACTLLVFFIFFKTSDCCCSITELARMMQQTAGADKAFSVSYMHWDNLSLLHARFMFDAEKEV